MSRASILISLAAVVLAACGIGGGAGEPQEAVALTSLPGLALPATTSPATGAAPDPGLPLPPLTAAPPLPTTTVPEPPPEFEYAIRPVTAETVSESWNEECPLHWEELSLLTLSYWNFDGRPVKGRMVINTSLVDDVVTVFGKLFAMKFPIERIALVDNYGGDDDAVMRANVTSGFNCRYVDGTERWSNHAFGRAIDINPLLNPWARAGGVLPVEGTKHAENRDAPVPGMINAGDPVVAVFEQAGWSWGGVWRSADYMHFSKTDN